MHDGAGGTHDHDHDHGHGHGHDPEDGPASGGAVRPAGGHADLVARNKAAAAQLLPAALADIEARAAQPLEGLPMAAFEAHIAGIVRAAHAALFLKEILEEGEG
jgi:hypothetical protein